MGRGVERGYGRVRRGGRVRDRGERRGGYKPRYRSFGRVGVTGGEIIKNDGR